MVGLIIRWGSKVVITTGETQEEAEEIAVAMFREVGIELAGVEVVMVVFDPNQSGGLLIDPQEDQGSWTPDGWRPSDPPSG